MIRRLAILGWIIAASALGASADPIAYSFNCTQSETCVRILTWRDSTGALVNLTGYTAKLQIRSAAPSSIVLKEYTEASGLVLGGVAGTITWTITSAETAALPAGSLAYDLRLTSGVGVATYLAAGYVNVRQGVTR